MDHPNVPETLQNTHMLNTRELSKTKSCVNDVASLYTYANRQRNACTSRTRPRVELGGVLPKATSFRLKPKKVVLGTSIMDMHG